MRDDQDLVNEFQILYSNLERALKRTRYFRNRRGILEPNWDTFAIAMRNSFETNLTEEIQSAFEYFYRTPPKRLEQDSNGIVWVDAPIQGRDGEYIVNCIRRIRNNLIHGEKIRGNDFRNIQLRTERDRELLIHSINILRYLQNVDNEVRQILEMN